MSKSCGKAHYCGNCKVKWYCGDSELDPICPQKYRFECNSCRFDKTLKYAVRQANKLPAWKKAYIEQLDKQ